MGGHRREWRAATVSLIALGLVAASGDVATAQPTPSPTATASACTPDLVMRQVADRSVLPMELANGVSVANAPRQKIQLSTDTTICGLDWQIFNAFGSTGTLHAEIWLANATGTPVTQVGGDSDPLDVVSGVPTLPFGPPTHFTWSSNLPVLHLADAQYWAVLQADGITVVLDLQQSAANSAYDGVSYNGFLDGGDTGRDYYFQIYRGSAPSATATPIPTAIRTPTGPERFPAALYSYTEPSGEIRKKDFSAVAREVQAVEAWLGVNGRNVPAVDTRCAYVELPVSNEVLGPIWRAPYAATITQVYCKRTGGTSALFDLEVDDGTPSAVIGAPSSCSGSTGGLPIPILIGDTSLATGDRLQLHVGTVSAMDPINDPVKSLSICWTYVPA